MKRSNAEMFENVLRGVKRVHFVGIGGSGMSPLAEILHSRGYNRSINESVMSAACAA